MDIACLPWCCLVVIDERKQLRLLIAGTDTHLLLFAQMDSPDQKKLEIMIGDFMKAKLPYFDVCISNTPYQVCSQGGMIRITASKDVDFQRRS